MKKKYFDEMLKRDLKTLEVVADLSDILRVRRLTLGLGFSSFEAVGLQPNTIKKLEDPTTKPSVVSLFRYMSALGLDRPIWLMLNSALSETLLEDTVSFRSNPKITAFNTPTPYRKPLFQTTDNMRAKLDTFFSENPDLEHVCTLMLWVEALGNKGIPLTKLASREINHVMRNDVNWSYTKSTKNFPEYGKQRYYTRIKTDDLL